MRAIGVVEFGGPDSLQLVELPDPEPVTQVCAIPGT